MSGEEHFWIASEGVLMGPEQGQKMGVNVLLLRGQNLKIRLRHDTDRTLICHRVNFQAVPSIHCREKRDVTHRHTDRQTHRHTDTLTH